MKKNFFKLILIAGLLAGAASALGYSDFRDPGGIAEGLPVRLKIPVIGVNAAIEDALVTPEGRMDVPAGTVNVAWFALGPAPGAVGSAVIGGHYGTSNGVKFVFYDLNKLKVGDNVYIENDKGQTLAFQVRSISSYDRNADATAVFTSSDGLAHLNIITCEGIWNKVADTYPERRVVFTDAIPWEGPAPAPFAPLAVVPQSPTVVPSPAAPVKVISPAIAGFPPIGLGDRGPIVASLQNLLVEKGFLIMPPGAVKGYYGNQTQAAVVKYQSSIGYQPTGVFDRLTRARLFASETPAIAKTTLPSTALTPSEPVFIPAPEIRTSGPADSLESLYATPTDGLITLLLLIAIIFVIFKIIRRLRTGK